ncbi:hypothetical protein ABGN35_000050 [Yersinia enterocolitica]
MNNIEKIIRRLKTRVALAELIGPDEMIVSASDLSALIAQLEAANEKLSKPVVLPAGYSVRAGHPINEGERNVMIPKEGGRWLSRLDVEHAIRVAGFTVKEDATPIVIVPAPDGVIMRPQSENPLERCAAGRDGECHHKGCPQLRDNEPMATGRHCPIDNWDDE